MGVLGISLIVASVVYVFFGPSHWLPPWIPHWRGLTRVRGAIADVPRNDDSPDANANGRADGNCNGRASKEAVSTKGSEAETATTTAVGKPNESSTSSTTARKTASNKATMPPPPLPIISPPPPVIQEPTAGEEATTPKATARAPSQPVPSFTLSDDPSPPSAPRLGSMMPPPLPPARVSASPASPGRLPSAGRLPQFPAANSAQRARGPVPNRNPMAPSSSSGLALPPTHSSKPDKPSRKVLLAPGHSPLDWARISGSNADLRGVPSSTPYLRITPSMLKKQTGRKGKDGWMALNGKVYNVTPYAAYHPGGIPELMRGAGRDGTKLFGEVHPWVNYETMLSACLVGLLVDEEEGNKESEMDKMD